VGRLAKNYYSTANGERRLNCYSVNIPKEIIKSSEIEEDDEIRIYVEYGRIIIEQKYYYVCEECGYEWPSGKPYTVQSSCPRCHCGDLRECNNDN